MQRTRLATATRRRRRAAAPAAPVVVATQIFAVEGELLATMDAVASRRVLKRDIKELTRLILVGGERTEYGPTAIPNLSRVGTYQPLPPDYEAQAMARNAEGVSAAAPTYSRVGAAPEAKPQVATATFVPTAAANGTGRANGTQGRVNGHAPVAPGPPTPPAPQAPAVAPQPVTPQPAAQLPPPPPPPIAAGPVQVSRVVDGKVVPAAPAAPAPSDPMVSDPADEDLSGSALSSIDATALFGTFEVDAALGGWDTRR